jgi:SAM-dependent methyltransferase
MAAGYDPTIYDLFHDDEAPDVRWYRAQAVERGGRVLELGSGTGRTLLPVARADGLELDDTMIAALQSKLAAEPSGVRELVRVFRGDMRAFSLPERYRGIQIPFRTFLFNRTRKEQLGCLAACYEHLEPGGSLTFNVFHPSLAIMSKNHGALAGVWRWRAERVTSDGKRVVLSDMTVVQPDERLCRARHRYECFDARGHLEWSAMLFLDLAYLYPSDARELLRETGFVDVEIFGNFGERPLVRDEDEMVIRAHRPG